jgi:hypothetical protein
LRRGELGDKLFSSRTLTTLGVLYSSIGMFGIFGDVFYRGCDWTTAVEAILLAGGFTMYRSGSKEIRKIKNEYYSEMLFPDYFRDN